MAQTIIEKTKKILRTLPGHIIRISSTLFSLLILAMAIAVLVYAAHGVYVIFKAFTVYEFKSILYEAALIVVLVKVFQLLLQYYHRQSVSIKEVLEVAIVALIINTAFGFEMRDIWMNVVMGVLTLGNLITYLVFHEKLSRIERD